MNSPLSSTGIRPDLDLDLFFNPRAMAVVGASDTPDRPTTFNWRFVKRWADAHGVPIHPVNPNKSEVDGLKAYPRVTDIPGDVDVAILLLGDPSTVVPDLVAKGIGFAVAFAGGFAETGDDGAAKQQQLVELFRGSGTRLIGPNANVNAFQQFRDDLPGKAIALVSQSGHQGRPIYQGQEIGIKVSHWAPTGNEADVESADFIRYFSTLPGTGTVAAYIEGFKDGRTFMRAADDAAKNGVPIVIVKVGRTSTGQSWAQSHTGHLAGRDDITSAVMRQYGVTRVDDLDQLLETSAFLARTPPPAAEGVCVYSISGGTSGHMADILGMAGVPVPELTPATQEQLREWIPGFLRISNPVDCGGQVVGDWRGRRILETILEDPNVGVLVVPVAGAFPPLSDHLVKDLVELSETSDKPICVIWGSPTATEDAYRNVLLKSSIPTFRTLRNCAASLRAYFDYHRFRRDYRSPWDGDAAPVASDAAPALRQALAAGTLSEVKSKGLLRSYGIRTSRDLLCLSADEVADAAKVVGFPLVMKVVSDAIAHKSDHGLVRVGVRDLDEATAVFEDMRARAEQIAPGRIDGIMVSEQVGGGAEIVIGAVRDELFGTTIMFGVGGVSVEVYKDVTFRVPPFGVDEARRMVGEIRGLPLLTGSRGRPAADLEAIAQAIMTVQQIVIDAGDALAELDINPLIATPEGVIAVDALFVASDGPASGGH